MLGRATRRAAAAEFHGPDPAPSGGAWLRDGSAAHVEALCGW